MPFGRSRSTPTRCRRSVDAERPGRAARLALTLTLAASLAEAGEAPFTRFEVEAAGHAWINAYLLANVSDLVHRDMVEHHPGEAWTEKFGRAFESWGLQAVAFLEDPETDTQALVLQSPGMTLIAFSGSETYDKKSIVRDWLKTDGRVRPVEVDGFRIHRGFQLALDSIWDDVLAAARAAVGERRALWLTGHSLGGALANLTAYRLSGAGIEVTGVTAFAAPKLGDVAFVAELERRLGERSQQWSAALDPVPRLPELGDRTAYEKLGVTNVVHASGRAELDTTQRMRRLPNPRAHRMAAYLTYLYRALPEEVRRRVPPPPPLCRIGSKLVGQHPDDRYPMCLWNRLCKKSPERCTKRGGEIVGSWCLREVPGKFRYTARKLRTGNASPP